MRLVVNVPGIEYKAKRIAEEMVLCHTFDDIPAEDKIFLLPTVRGPGKLITLESLVKFMTKPPINRCENYKILVNLTRSTCTHKYSITKSLKEDKFDLIAVELVKGDHRYPGFELRSWLRVPENAKFFFFHLDRFQHLPERFFPDGGFSRIDFLSHFNIKEDVYGWRGRRQKINKRLKGLNDEQAATIEGIASLDVVELKKRQDLIHWLTVELHAINQIQALHIPVQFKSCIVPLPSSV